MGDGLKRARAAAKATQFDAVAVNLATSKVRIMATGKYESDADAIVAMAVARRGVETEFFAAVPAGKYKTGDDWKGNTDEALSD